MANDQNDQSEPQTAEQPGKIARLIRNLGLMLKVSMYLVPNFALLWTVGPVLLSHLPETISAYVYWGVAFYLFAGSNFALARSDTKSVRDEPFSIDTLLTITIAAWLWPWLRKK